MLVSWYGSSPHVRGTGTDERILRRRGRFIPACAGNREAAGVADVYGPVHPRMCGEQSNCNILNCIFIHGFSQSTSPKSYPPGSGTPSEDFSFGAICTSVKPSN